MTPVKAHGSVDRKPVMASYWQYDPTSPDDDPDVEAMPAALSFIQSDVGHVLISVRGKPGARYEKGDSAWIELTDAEAVRLIERLSAAVARNLCERGSPDA